MVNHYFLGTFSLWFNFFEHFLDVPIECNPKHLKIFFNCTAYMLFYITFVHFLYFLKLKN